MSDNKNKKLKRIIATIGGLSPLVLILLAVIIVVVGAMWPIFLITSIVGGDTVYSSNDIPTELTIEGIETWTDEERKIFDVLELENGYYNNDFSHYNATNILANKEEKLAVSVPIATASYQGTVNLDSFDEEFDEEYFENINLDPEYENEKHVYNSETRDFYKQAGKRVGNTFMIYPGMRMLLGYLVKNNVTFSVVTYEEEVIDGEYYDNSAAIYSDWSYLGKIVSSNEDSAKKPSTPTSAVNKVVSAINFGQGNDGKCNNTDDEWLNSNYCFDTDMLFTEIFGEKFADGEVRYEDIETYLKDNYEGASIPPGSSDQCPEDPENNKFCPLENGDEYIAVRVEKQIDYELYSKYLKEVYIPYLYINCDDCGYRNESEELKKAEAERIHDEIMNLVSTFKTYNNEDYVESSGTQTISGITYDCGDNIVSLVGDYNNHFGNDFTSTAPNPNVYPFIEGEVIYANDGCPSTCNQKYTYVNWYEEPDENERYNQLNDAWKYVEDKSVYDYIDPVCRCGDGYGNVVKIKGVHNGKTVYVNYAHLASVSVKVGDIVTYNTILGVYGNSGVSTGDHLHIDMDYGNGRFKPTEEFTLETLKGTLCKRSINGDNDEE